MTCGVCENKADGLCDFHFLRSLIWRLDTDYYGTVEKEVSAYGSHYIIKHDSKKITVDDKDESGQLLAEILGDLNK